MYFRVENGWKRKPNGWVIPTKVSYLESAALKVTDSSYGYYYVYCNGNCFVTDKEGLLAIKKELDK